MGRNGLRRPPRHLCWLGLVALLSACNRGGVEAGGQLLMLDCQFQRNGLVHLHLSPLRGNANVISAYRQARGEGHTRSLRESRESKAQLVEPGGDRYVLELFLLNDHFGERSGETVRLRLAKDGRALFEARSQGQRSRQIDAGSCVNHNHHNS